MEFVCEDMIDFITYSSQKKAIEAENFCFSGKSPPFLLIYLKLVSRYSIIFKIINFCIYAVNSIKDKKST